MVHEGEKNHICSHCGYAGFTLGHLKRHIKRHHEKRTKNYKCDLCDKTFYEQYTLNSHKRKVHDGIRDKICKFCGKTFKEVHHLKNHIKGIHEGISWKEVLKKKSNPKSKNKDVLNSNLL